MITKAIKNLVPNAKFIISGNFTYDDIEWQDSRDKPSKADVDAEIIKVTAEYDAKQYQRDRQYPNLGEQLDMLFHDMTAGKGSKTGEWYKAIAKVKSDNPKG
jgi:hypothetical protein